VIVEVKEVTELLPPRGDFRFVHVTARVVSATPPAPGGLPPA
jgi:hypothetical protein